MEIKKVVPKNLYKHITIGGLGALVFGAAAYYFFKGKKQEQPQASTLEESKEQTRQNNGPKLKSLPKKEMIDLLNEVTRELNPLFKVADAESKALLRLLGCDSLEESVQEQVLITCNMIFTFS